MNATSAETTPIKDTWNYLGKLSNWVDAAPDKYMTQAQPRLIIY